jgi:uncharacterized protein with HEPN domain
MTPRDREALQRMVECAGMVEGYVERAGPGWAADDMAVDAIAKRIEEIGEVAKRVGLDTLALMPDIDWRGVKGIREVIAHDYEEIDLRILGDVVQNKLPQVVAVVSRMLASDK